MALNPPSPFRVRPVAVTLATTAAVVVFIVVVAVAARMTADSAVVVMRHAGPDHGVGVVVDAGPGAESTVDGGAFPGSDSGSDAGVLVTVEGAPDAGPEPDAGPPTVEEPPYEPSVVAAAAVIVVESCAKDALRWDPSLGGPFTLRVEFPTVAAAPPDDGTSDGDTDAGIVDVGNVDVGAAPRLLARGLTSPVLEACLLRRADQIVRAPGTRDLVVPQAVEARAVLRADGTIAISDAVVVAVTGR